MGFHLSHNFINHSYIFIEVSQIATPQKKKKMIHKKPTALVIPNEILINKIFFLRKHKVMLDRDLAELYGVTSRRLREQVKRNAGNFPPNFMFVLNVKEVEILVSQQAIPSKRHLGGARPMAFTEHGVLMLSNVLKSKQAIKVSIRIIEIFIKLREMLYDNLDLRNALEKLERKTENNTKNIEVVFQYFDELLQKKMTEKPRKKIGYKIPKN